MELYSFRKIGCYSVGASNLDATWWPQHGIGTAHTTMVMGARWREHTVTVHLVMGWPGSSGGSDAQCAGDHGREGQGQ
jgi:hypothetical protein